MTSRSDRSPTGRRPEVLSAELAGVELVSDGLRVGLLTARGVTTITLGLEVADRQALPAVVALYGHGRGCPNSVEVHVGLLVRTVSALGGGQPRLVVRPGGEPTVALRLQGDQPQDIPVSTLDACCLLYAPRVSVAVEPAR